jgi:hypothetical protein
MLAQRVPHARDGAEQMPYASAVDVIDVGEIEQNFSIPFA